MRMVVAGVVSGLDGGLKVEDIHIIADNDLIMRVESVEAESGHGSVFRSMASALASSSAAWSASLEADVV